jgi:hypothetical protein
MGFEAFRAELRGGRATYSEAEEVVRTLPHARPDLNALETRGSSFYLIDDGQHIIEIEVLDDPVRLSCRFTLCHPPSVDRVYLDLVRELLARLGMQARICDDVRPEDSRPFSLAEFHDFAAITQCSIAGRRAEWIEGFGDETMAASMEEVYRRVILPRCQPVTDQTS